MYYLVFGIFSLFICSVRSDEYDVRITNDGPIVLGGTIVFRAQLYYEGKKVSGSYSFEWQDNAFPKNRQTFETTDGTSAWNVTYSKDKYSPGLIEVQVAVTRSFALIHLKVASERQFFNVTSLLNGHIDLEQGNTILGGKYVNVDIEVDHHITLNSADSKVIVPNKTDISTYWFLNCEYIGVSSSLSFPYNYSHNDAGKVFDIRVWLIVSSINSTNSSSHIFNSTNEIESSSPNVTSSTTTTTTSTTTPVPVTKRPVIQGCGDDPMMPIDPNKYYGYFKKQVQPDLPVSVTNIDGSRWLKNGELLQLNLTCGGSPPFYHCVRWIKGEYNKTGNETCNYPGQVNSCQMAVTRLLSPGSHFTVLFIVSNKVSKVIQPVGVTMYSEPTLPQLSVIIVPITCSSIAVVLIIFGIAYYVQSKNRYTIEVADFDFTRRNDTEYKTFKERLADAVSSAFTRVHEEYSEEGPIGNVWSPTRKNHPRQGLLFESDSETIDP